ncbi:MAG: oligosaccharide flippase family protein [Gammaproteobacteria bacterium]|nr:oligosaccharide flippase family protein [Gammaproteobacteria bacterium]
MNNPKGGFAANFAWLLGSEGLVRISRLGTAVVLARYLSPLEFGVAALAIASHELLRVLAQNGFALRLIREKDADVDRLSNTLYALNWLWAVPIFLVQCGASVAVARYFDAPELQPMLLALAVIYLAMPLGLTQMYRVQRAGRLKVTAWVDSGQIMIDNILTAVLAVAGFGAWAIVLPKILVIPIWIIGYRLADRWRFNRAYGFASFTRAFTETRGVLTSEVARSLRAQLDIFVIGRFLGTEALGLYFFARNSGLGISLAMLQAATHAMLPQLGEVARRFGHGDELRAESIRILRLILIVTLPIIAAQALLAPYYVPLVFGEQWLPAVPVLMLLCLSAVPRIAGESVTQLARATGRAHLDARWNVWSAPVFLIVVALGCNHGLLGTAVAVCAFHWLYQTAFTGSVLLELFRVRVPLSETIVLNRS